MASSWSQRFLLEKIWKGVVAMISAVIIARNEEKHIEECLKSVKWVDETIVVDNASEDLTVKIAKELGAKVYEYEKVASEGHFAEMRNFAISKVKGDWILFVDADEKVTTSLRDEILKVTDNSGVFSAYAIPRRNILLGHEMHWGGWWPDYVLRLIRKDKLSEFKGELHEQPVIRGEIGKLENPFIHTTHESLSEMVEKTNKWSEIEARLMYDAKHPLMNVWRFCTAIFREFWYRAIVKLGFLDGSIGLIEIIYQCFSRFVSYSKLWELQNKNASRNF